MTNYDLHSGHSIALYPNLIACSYYRSLSIIPQSSNAQNSWATNHLITDETAIEIVRAGRTRWKVENENNNTLKTKGYNLEHNFGHGKHYLASFLASLNILSLLFHTLLELLDEKYKLLRAHLPTRKTFFDDLRALTRYLVFDSWDHLLTFMIQGLELDLPLNTS